MFILKNFLSFQDMAAGKWHNHKKDYSRKLKSKTLTFNQLMQLIDEVTRNSLKK
jgi:hypothetical protein